MNIKYVGTAKLNITCFLNFFWFSIILILYVIDYFVGDVFDLIKIIFSIWFLNNTFLAFKHYGFFSVYTIFLLLNLFFIYDAILLDVFNYSKLDNFLIITFPKKYRYSIDVGKNFILYSSTYLFILDISIRYFKNNFLVSKRMSFIKESDNKFANDFCFFLLLLIFPVSLYRSYQIFMYIWKQGYVYYILNGLPAEAVSSWTNGAMGLFYVFFLVLVINPINKNKFKITCILCGFIFFLQGLSGGRGGFLYHFFALIIVYLSFFSTKKISIKTILFLILLCLAFSLFVGQTREQTNKNTMNLFFNNNIILDFLASQTNSRAVPLTVIQGNIPFHEKPFIFSPLFDLFYNNDSASRFEMIKSTNSIDLLTCYKISKTHTLSGNGLGGAVIGEFIDCGSYFGVVGWTIILALIIYFLDNFDKISSRYRPLCFIFLVNLIHAPRGYFFPNPLQLKYVLFALVLYYLFVYINRTFVKTKYLIG